MKPRAVPNPRATALPVGCQRGKGSLNSWRLHSENIHRIGGSNDIVPRIWGADPRTSNHAFKARHASTARPTLPQIISMLHAY
jgi:hypothetical protein